MFSPVAFHSPHQAGMLNENDPAGARSDSLTLQLVHLGEKFGLKNMLGLVGVKVIHCLMMSDIHIYP